MYSHLIGAAISKFKHYNNTVNKMDTSSDLISRLKFIGCIKKYEKINTKHLYVQSDNLSTRISRAFIYQDNRGNTLSFVQETISRAFELLTTLERSERDDEKILGSNLLKDLHQSKKGLINLKDTYIDDTKFCCDISTLLERVDAKLQSKNYKDIVDNFDSLDKQNLDNDTDDDMHLNIK